jgi:DNA-directed RNA polymerase subunit RPC12/RpoP
MSIHASLYPSSRSLKRNSVSVIYFGLEPFWRGWLGPICIGCGSAIDVLDRVHGPQISGRNRCKRCHQNELLKQRIYKDKVHTSLNALEATWYTAWHELSLEDVNECILGLPARIQKVYGNEGRNNFHGLKMGI